MYVNRDDIDEDDFDYFKIDPYDLQKEWLTQVKIFRKHGHMLADAKEDLERAEAKKKVVWAELDRDVRANPANYLLTGKITEAVVENTIILQPSYQKAVESYIAAKHRVDISQVDVETLRQKKDALEAAVKMLLSEFWSEPRVKGDAGQEIKNMELRQTRKLGQKKRGET